MKTRRKSLLHIKIRENLFEHPILKFMSLYFRKSLNNPTCRWHLIKSRRVFAFCTESASLKKGACNHFKMTNHKNHKCKYCRFCTIAWTYLFNDVINYEAVISNKNTPSIVIIILLDDGMLTTVFLFVLILANLILTIHFYLSWRSR